MQVITFTLLFFVSCTSTIRIQRDVMQNESMYWTVRTCPKYYTTRVPNFLTAWGEKVRGHLSILAGAGGANQQFGIQEVSECKEDHGLGLCCKEAGQLELGVKKQSSWLWVGDDDLFVHTENINKILNMYNPEEPQILGIPGCGDYGLCGGGGYAISKAALQHMIQKTTHGLHEKFMSIANEWVSRGQYPWSDQITAKIAKESGVVIKSLPGLYGWKFETVEERQRAMTNVAIRPLSFHYVTLEEMLELGSFFNSPRHAVQFGTTKTQYETALQIYDQQMTQYVQKENTRRTSMMLNTNFS